MAMGRCNTPPTWINRNKIQMRIFTGQILFIFITNICIVLWYDLSTKTINLDTLKYGVERPPLTALIP